MIRRIPYIKRIEKGQAESTYYLGQMEVEYNGVIYSMPKYYLLHTKQIDEIVRFGSNVKPIRLASGPKWRHDTNLAIHILTTRSQALLNDVADLRSAIGSLRLALFLLGVVATLAAIVGWLV